MKYLLGGVSLLVLFACASAQPAHAQASNYTVVTSCDTITVPASQGTSGPFMDVNGKICTNATGGSGSNAAAGPTGAAVPPDGDYQGLNVGGTLRGQTGTNTSGSVYAGDVNVAASALPTGAATAANQTTANSSLSTIAGAVGSSIPAGTAVIGYTTPDPCSQFSKSGGVINLTASGQIITGTAAKKTYICSIHFVSATAQNIALVEGTGSTCATNIFGLAGGTTAAAGWNLSANGGMTLGNGLGTVISPSADSNATAANVCLLLSSTGQTSGQIAYVQQ